MSLNAADQGAWAAGLGALAAALAALYISQKSERRRKREAHRKQRLVASYHFTHLAYLARNAAHLHRKLIDFSNRAMEHVSNNDIAKFQQMIKEMSKIVNRAKISEISQLPSNVAESIGFAVGGYTFVFEEIDSTLASLEAQTRGFHELQAELRTRTLGLNRPIGSTIVFIKWFRKEFGMQGDGDIAGLLNSIELNMKVENKVSSTLARTQSGLP